MTGNYKPAAWRAAGSRIGAHSRQAARTKYEALHGSAQARLSYLRTLADVVSKGASEAPTRESCERLLAATGDIFDALAIERRALACGRAAP